MHPVNSYQGKTYRSSFKEDLPVAIKKICENNSKKLLIEELAAIRDSILLSNPQINKKLTRIIAEIRDEENGHGGRLIKKLASTVQENFIRSVPLKIFIINKLFDSFGCVFIKKLTVDLPFKFIEALAIFNKEKDSRAWIKYINETIIPNLDPITENKECYSAKSILELLSIENVNLLNKTSEEILDKRNESNEVDLGKAVVFNFSVLSGLMKMFLLSVPLTHPQERFLISSKSIQQSTSQAFDQIIMKANLSNQRKTDVILLFTKLLMDIAVLEREFDYFSHNIMKSDLFIDHLIKLITNEVDICNTGKGCDFSIILNDRDLYETLIPKCEELCKWLSEKSKVIHEKYVVLKDFLLYIKLGNLDKIAKLPQICPSEKQFSSIVINEIKNFQTQMKEIEMAKKALSAMTEYPCLKRLREILLAHELFYANISFISQFAISDIIEVCRRSAVNLPFPINEGLSSITDVTLESDSSEHSAIEADTPSFEESESAQEHQSSDQSVESISEENSVQETESSEHSITESISEEKSVQETKTSIPVTTESLSEENSEKQTNSAQGVSSAQRKILTEKKKDKSKPTLVETIQLLDESFAFQLPALLNVTNSLGFKDAINNSFDHLDDLLTELKRFERIIKELLHKDELLNTIVNFVNHGTLLTEQLLTALLCKTKSYKKEKDLHAALTHQLPLLLVGCQLGSFPISRKTRGTILYTNSGEILSRDLVSLIDNGTPNPNSSVEDLLSAAYSWSVSENQQTSELIIKASFDYVANILHACNELIMHIKTDDRERGKALIAEQKKTTKMISHLRKSLLIAEKKMGILSNNQLPLTNELSVINQKIDGFLNQSTLPIMIRKGLENIQKNYLRRLNIELLYQKQLPYKELRLHYCHILMLNQFIAEDFCSLLISFRHIQVNKKEIDHNLGKWVKALGMDIKKFPGDVQSFLSSGKDVRALTRYRFSFSKNNTVIKNLQYVSKIAQDKQFTESGNDGFQLVESKKNGIKTMLDDAKSNVTTLKNLILTLCAFLPVKKEVH